MDNQIIINKDTPVRIQEWTMEGMMGVETVPLEDVLTYLRKNISCDEDRAAYCRLFSLTGSLITIDEIDYEIENNASIEDIIMAKGSFGTYISERRFSAENYLKDCGFSDCDIPRMKEKLNTYDKIRKNIN